MRIRSMSAGRAGASVYNANVNGDQGGGNAKQGLAPTTNKRVNFVLRAIQMRATATKTQRAMVFCQNQLGGIGAPSKMFATGADGASALCKSKAKCHNFVYQAYQELLKRSVDPSGYRTYTQLCKNEGYGATIISIMNSAEYKKLFPTPPVNHAKAKVYAENGDVTAAVTELIGGSAALILA